MKSDFERFITKVDINPGGCWTWRSSLNNKGYGDFHCGGGSNHCLAHRWMYELAYGPIPAGFVVMHVCDNPPCVCPSHLRIGTMADNQADMASKLRSGQAKMNPEKVRAIRAMSEMGVSHSAIADKMSISRPTVTNIVKRQTWRHVK